MEHTHLVKGLDFALLAKIKSEQTQKEKEDKEKTMTEQEVKQAKADKKSGLPPMKPPTIASALGAKKVEATAAPAVPVLTPMGKSILRLINKKPTKNELFLPGRMAFVFDLEDEFRQELPTTLLRSKEDCPKEVDALAGKIDSVLLEKITKVLNFLRQGSSTHKKLRKKEKAGAAEETKEIKPVPIKPVEEEDDDIFADAGKDYVVTTETKVKNEEDTPKETKAEQKEPKKELEPPKDEKREDRKKEDRKPDKRDDRDKREDRDDRDDRRDSKRDEKRDDKKRDEKDDKKDSKDKKAKPTYFQTPADSDDAYTTAENTAKRAVEEAKQLAMQLNPEGTLKEEKKQAEAEQKAKDARAKKEPGFVEDTYSECYPGSYETAMYAYESDEEDITKMDMGGSKKGKLKRWDFDDDESWNEYNDQREAMPKAAFQFGVKMSAGRKTRKNAKDNKDALKINTILKQRAVDAVQAKKMPDAEPKGKRRRVND